MVTMAGNRRDSKMSDRKRHLYYLKRKAIGLIVILAVAGTVCLADRLGLFGVKPPGDLKAYHGKSFLVINVVDGDTLDLDAPDATTGAAYTRVRLWGVDTPEVAEPNPPQHFGPEASAFTRQMCLKKTVTLELDGRSTRCVYGRLLAYASLPDGQVLNRLLVAGGYGYADPRFSHRYDREYRSLQKQAQKAGRGLWKDLRRDQLPYYYHDLKLPATSRFEGPD